MPDENPILTYWRTELEILNKNLLLLREQTSEKAIHDLRVAIKKLRSCFKMYSQLVKKKGRKELTAGIDSLFSILGKHRNVEMSKKLLVSFAGKNTAVVNPILVYLQLLQDQAGEYSRPAIKQFEPGKLEALTNQMETGLEDLNNEEILPKTKEIFDSSVEKVEDDLKHFEERSHLVRKQLKDIFYQSKILHGKGQFSKSQLKTLDTILDHLGNVHDHEVLISLLKTFRKTILSKGMKETTMIKKIEGRAKKKKNSLLEKAYNSIEELISHYKNNKQESQELKQQLTLT